MGATREEIDPVRFISNRSSGRMGFAIAEAAVRRGGEVTVVAGVTTVAPPPGVKIVEALSAEEMSRAVARERTNATVFIGAAANRRLPPVSTSRPENQEVERLIYFNSGTNTRRARRSGGRSCEWNVSYRFCG